MHLAGQNHRVYRGSNRVLAVVDVHIEQELCQQHSAITAAYNALRFILDKILHCGGDIIIDPDRYQRLREGGPGTQVCEEIYSAGYDTERTEALHGIDIDGASHGGAAYFLQRVRQVRISPVVDMAAFVLEIRLKT